MSPSPSLFSNGYPMTSGINGKSRVASRLPPYAYLALLIVASIGVLVIASPEERYVWIPILASFNLVLWLGAKLWKKDAVFPLFDAGLVCAVATCCYITIPLLNFLAGGLSFTALSDNRLFVYQPSPEDLGIFSLRPVVYLAALVLVYGLSRGKGYAHQAVEAPSLMARQTVVLLLLLCIGYILSLQALTGFRFKMSYEDLREAYETETIVRLPLLVLQISLKLQKMFLTLKLVFLAMLMQLARERRWRLFLFGWLLVEVVIAVTRLGARGEVVLLLMAAALAYHRMVRPLTLRFIVPAGLALLLGFLVMGFIRDVTVKDSGQDTLLSSANEFQSLLATAYDLYSREQLFGLEVPWQVYASDIIPLLPPQQILPFEKFDGAEWYLRLLGLEGTGVGFMFGVTAQAVIGLDWVELLLRGAFLGFILAMFHRWYAARSSLFFPTFLYLWLCLKVYYTYRNTTLSPLVSFVYEVLPAFILIEIVSLGKAFRKKLPIPAYNNARGG